MKSLELRIPPVIVMLIVGTAMWAASQAIPSLEAPLPVRAGLAITLGSIGVLVALAGVIVFRRAGTTLHPQRPEASSAVVRSGVFAYSRNPMYLGMFLVLLAWAAWLANVVSLALAFTFVAYLNRFQIAPEERVLAARFGAAYIEYMGKVRRWL
jgi:protein-S-isoprenylcysteine O-methyltransferase Ste14